MVVIVLEVPSTGMLTDVGNVNKVPTFGISIEAVLKVSVTEGVVGWMSPERTPLIETETGELLPNGKGAVSVICKVNVEPAGIVMLVLLFMPEKANVPKVGLLFVVMSVDDWGV